MRSSIGATWIFSICLTFIMLFVAYLAISLNYSKAFKVKSQIVSMIEENEGYVDSTDALNERISNYLISEGYVSYGRCEPNISVPEEESDWDLAGTLELTDVPANSHSVCIYKSSKEDYSTVGNRTKYRVITFFKFDLPVLGHFTSFQVGGETRYFHDFTGKDTE